MTEFSNALRSVWAQNAATQERRLAIQEQAIVHLLAGSLEDAGRQLAVSEAHKLAGSLGSFGLIEGSRLASELETAWTAEGPLFTQAIHLAELTAGVRREMQARTHSFPTQPGPPDREHPADCLAERPAYAWHTLATTLPNTPLAAATNRMLARASALPAYGPTFGATVDRNVLMRVTNTDDLLQRIAAGEADATIVFSSDVSPDGRKQLQVIDLPDDVNEQLEFSVAVLKGPNGGGAQTFVAYLQSALAQTTLTRYGFVEPFSAPVEVAAGEPSETFSPTFDVRGLVATPHTFTRAEIAQLPQESATLATPSGSATYTGTRLLNVFNAAGGAKLPTDINNAKLRVSVRITGADGSDLLMGWGTLDPDFGALGAIVAITRDGEPLGDPDGMARLIVPGDKDDGRSIPSIVRIELSDPGPATL